MVENFAQILERPLRNCRKALNTKAMKLHEKIAVLQEKHTSSVRELARRFSAGYDDKVSANTIQRWIDGEMSPRVSEIARIAEVFGVPVGYLVDDEQDEPEDKKGSGLSVEEEVILGQIRRKGINWAWDRLFGEPREPSVAEGSGFMPAGVIDLPQSRPSTVEPNGDHKNAPSSDRPATRR